MAQARLLTEELVRTGHEGWLTEFELEGMPVLEAEDQLMAVAGVAPPEAVRVARTMLPQDPSRLLVPGGPYSALAGLRAEPEQRSLGLLERSLGNVARREADPWPRHGE